MFKEYDVVELICDLEVGPKKGTRGTIVMIYPGQTTAFEVEFVDAAGNTIALRSGVQADQVKLVSRQSS